MKGEIGFLVEEKDNKHKENDKIRTYLENIMSKNTLLQDEIDKEKNISPQRIKRASQLVGNMDAEKKELKVVKYEKECTTI